MGDNLAEQLYRAFCNASGLVAGSGDVPNWASMPSAQREVWEQVAAKARNEMAVRFVASLDDAVETHGPFGDWCAVVDALGRRWRRS